MSKKKYYKKKFQTTFSEKPVLIVMQRNVILGSYVVSIRKFVKIGVGAEL